MPQVLKFLLHRIGFMILSSTQSCEPTVETQLIDCSKKQTGHSLPAPADILSASLENLAESAPAHVGEQLTHIAGCSACILAVDPVCSESQPWSALYSMYLHQKTGWWVLQLEAVVRRIKHLMQKDAAAKVLVFSSWQDVLELVSHALQTNKMPYAYARGRKAFDTAVADFKQAGSGQCPAVQILLLLVKQGANGLNLTGVMC